MDIEFPGQAQDVHQALQRSPLALVARIDLRIHQVQHGAQAPGRHPDLVQLLHVLSPVRLAEQLLQARQAHLEGAVEQDRQVGWMHPMILDARRESEKKTE